MIRLKSCRYERADFCSADRRCGRCRDGDGRLGKEAVALLAVLLAVLSNFFVLKQISLFGWTVTCSDAYVIGHLMCLNLLQQEYGKESARRSITLSFCAMLIFALLSQIHLLFTPSSFDTAHDHYAALLGVAPPSFIGIAGDILCGPEARSFSIRKDAGIFVEGQIGDLACDLASGRHASLYAAGPLWRSGRLGVGLLDEFYSQIRSHRFNGADLA